MFSRKRVLITGIVLLLLSIVICYISVFVVDRILRIESTNNPTHAHVPVPEYDLHAEALSLFGWCFVSGVSLTTGPNSPAGVFPFIRLFVQFLFFSGLSFVILTVILKGGD